MTNATLPIRFENEVALDTFAADMQVELTNSTNAWKRIADIFAAAQEQFGRQSKEMLQLGKKTGFTKSKIDKLVQIAKDSRIKANPKMFGTVSAWTVLYGVTLLNPQQFTQLSEQLEKGVELTSKLVASIRKPKKDQDSVQLQNFASIQLDLNAIRAGVMDQEDYEEMINTLQTLAERIPFIKITMNDILTKDIEKQQKEMHREYDRLVRRAFSDERQKHFNRIKLQYGADYLKSHRKEVIEETNCLLNDGSYMEAFDVIESDQYDQAEFWSEACRKMWSRREEKFKDRVSEPYVNANVVMLNEAA